MAVFTLTLTKPRCSDAAELISLHPTDSDPQEQRFCWDPRWSGEEYSVCESSDVPLCLMEAVRAHTSSSCGRVYACRRSCGVCASCPLRYLYFKREINSQCSHHVTVQTEDFNTLERSVLQGESQHAAFRLRNKVITHSSSRNTL